MTLLVFLVGVFISSIVALACGLIAYGLHSDHKERGARDI